MNSDNFLKLKLSEGYHELFKEYERFNNWFPNTFMLGIIHWITKIRHLISCTRETSHVPCTGRNILHALYLGIHKTCPVPG